MKTDNTFTTKLVEFGEKFINNQQDLYIRLSEVRSNPTYEEYIGAPGGVEADINVDIQNGKYTASDIIYLLIK